MVLNNIIEIKKEGRKKEKIIENRNEKE